MTHKIFISQSELDMGRNRLIRRLEVQLDSHQTKQIVQTRSRDKPLTSEDVLSGSQQGVKTGDNRELEGVSHLLTPDITFCKYLGKCPIVTRKKCMFNSGYENCQTYKFYKRWRR